MSILLRRAMMMASSLVKHIISSVTGLVTFTTNVAADMPSVLCEFTPVQSGSGDPSPNNVRPITGWTGLTVTKAGKNLLALPIVPYRSVNPYGGNANFNPADYFWIKAGTYTLSYIANESNRYLIKLFDASGNALSDAAHSPSANTYYNSSYKGWFRAANKASGTVEESFTIIEDCYIRICRNFSYPGDDTVVFTGCQLEAGSPATAYEAYSSTSIPVNWQADAGTVYGGTIDLVTGVLTVTMAYVDLGTLSWQAYRTFFYATVADKKSGGPGGSKDNVICDQYPTITYNQCYNGGAIGIAGYTYNRRLSIIDPAFNGKTGAEVKPLLSGIYAAYEIDPYQTYQLTPAQVQSIIGTNNVWHNTNGGITVKYYNKY